MVPVGEVLTQFEQAVARLAEALRLEKTEITRDSSLLRFEITFDLSWKTLKAYLEERLHVRCASPVACFREAYSQGLIPYENRWVDMGKDRNQIAHMYKQALAEAAYARLPEYCALFQDLVKKLREGS